MEIILLGILIVLVLIVMLLLVFQKSHDAKPELSALQNSLIKIEAELKEEARLNRLENATIAKDNRAELNSTLKDLKTELSSALQHIADQKPAFLKRNKSYTRYEGNGYD